jgi:uncharacterized RmlC-like cupin family protein
VQSRRLLALFSTQRLITRRQDRLPIETAWGQIEHVHPHPPYRAEIWQLHAQERTAWGYHRTARHTLYLMTGEIEVRYGLWDNRNLSEKSRLQVGDHMEIPDRLRYELHGLSDATLLWVGERSTADDFVTL